MGRHVPVKAAILAILLAACGGWHGPKPLQTWKGLKKSDDFIALDEAAHTLVAVQTRDVARTADGRLKIRVELANLSDKDLPVQVQTLFRDKSGTPSGEDTPFEVLVLPGMGSKLYEVTSLGSNADSFTIQVRTP